MIRQIFKKFSNSRYINDHGRRNYIVIIRRNREITKSEVAENFLIKVSLRTEAQSLAEIGFLNESTSVMELSLGGLITRQNFRFEHER